MLKSSGSRGSRRFFGGGGCGGGCCCGGGVAARSAAGGGNIPLLYFIILLAVTHCVSARIFSLTDPVGSVKFCNASFQISRFTPLSR